MRKIVIIFLLCTIALAQDKPYRILNSFNAGELSPLLTAREDLSKFQAGCSLMENMIPLPQGGAQKRPGTIYVAESKENTKIRLLSFEYSTEQSYIIEFGNQYARFFTDGAQILDGVGTETLTAVDGGNLVAHWLLNEEEDTNVENADNPGTYDGTATANATILHATGKVGTGCFDLDGQYTAYVADAAGLSFTDNSNDDVNGFSIVCWGYVSGKNKEQVLVSKWRENNAAREYKLSLTSANKLRMVLADTSSDLSANRVEQWYLDDTDADQVVDAVSGHTGATETANVADLSATGLTNMTPCFDLGGADAVIVTDHDELSFGNGSADSIFSVAAWVFVTPHTDWQTILSKWDSDDLKEWMFYLDADEKLVLRLTDNSAGGTILQTSDDALTTGWHFVAATYNASETATGIILYVDGDAVDMDASTTGSYTAMENLITTVVLGAINGAGAGYSLYWQDKIDNVMLMKTAVLSPANISTLYNSGNGTQSMPTYEISTVSDSAIGIGWHFFVVTYDGSEAPGGIDLYVDGSAVDSTDTDDTGYAAMQDGATLLTIGSQTNSGASGYEKFWDDKIDEVSLFNDVLISTEVASLYSTTPYEVANPYLTADLFELKMEQSADVLYITHPDYEIRKLSRLSNDNWTITAIDIQNGPFRTQNTITAGTIAASATTGVVTLTASGCTPFVSGTTAGHLPSGTAATDKSQTGALFKLVHPLGTLEYSETLTDNYTNSQTENTSWMDCGTVYKGGGWKIETQGTWTGTLNIQRNYTIGAAHGAAGWEDAMPPYTSTDDRNVITTTRTEDGEDASYRAILTESGDASEACKVYFTTDQTEHIGIVEITAVASATSATGTVIKTLGSIDATHKWSEGSWSNYRGWPIAVAFFEDRLTFGGNASQPDTVWGSVTSKYENMLAGVNDDDAWIFTLTSRQVNAIQWIVGKDKILIGTSGAEWTLDGSNDEPLTGGTVPKAVQHSTYGSENLQATLANESVLFFQQGAEKMRELAYNWEIDSYVAPDMTILAKEVTGDGITDTAFQQIPDAILWCVRDDGEIATFSYERKENITAWSRMITDGDFESVAVINGSTEDEVWVSVERTIDSNTVRYIEYFSTRDFGSDVNDAFYVDCGATYTSTSSITDLTWLEGETVSILADGDVLDSNTVSSSTIGLGATYSTVQVGLPYTVQMKTMPLSWIAQGMTIHGRIKRINEVITSWYESGDFSIGKDSSTLQTYSITRMTTNEDRKTFPPGYDRYGYVFIYQQSPEPLTLLALMIEFAVQ